MTTAFTHTAATVAGSHPVTFTPCQEKALDQVIAHLRTGAVSDVVLEHLEVDGVLQLEPLLMLSGGDPCAS